MTGLKPDFALVFAGLNVSPGADGVMLVDGKAMPALQLHLQVLRHTKDKPPAQQDLPPILFDARSAAALPAALMSAILKHLPASAEDARVQLLSVLGDPGSTPAVRQ